MKNVILLIALLIFVNITLIGQTISLTSTASPVNGTICPVISNTYSIDNIPSGCTPNWTFTNGQIVGTNNKQSITIIWNDTPGAIATLSVSFSNCTKESDNKIVVAPWSALILSVNGQSFSSNNGPASIDYCNTKTVHITVPHMFVQGTGGITQPPVQEVIYSWTLPPGWYAEGNITSTPLNGITIHPTACAVPGNVQVVGAINDRCGSAGSSAPMSISLSGYNPTVTIAVPQGYTGSTACNTTPVTFTALLNPSLGCVQSYAWSYPGSWQLISQTGNTIKLKPSGTPADSGPISVSISFTCGSVINSAPYTPPFVYPTVTGPAIICSTATYSINNNTASNQVKWSVNLSQALNIDPNTGTATVLAYGGPAKIMATFTNGCTVPITPLDIYVGLPSFNTISIDGNIQAYPFCDAGNIPYTALVDHIVEISVSGNTSPPVMTLNKNSAVVSGSSLSPTRFNFISKSASANFTISLSAKNTCGTNNQCMSFCNQNCMVINAQATRHTTINIFPNPAASFMTVQVKDSLSSDLRSTWQQAYQLKLMDNFGSPVYSAQSSGENINIPVHNFSPGIYYIHVLQRDAVIRRQVIIDR
ncbi:MAG: T9SS type A sorting domain-containing protein [Bacteroidetes bacterium]|nr:T9SS type A sorting domain-containing protein [Bacteroidota bacterium]MBS1539942.1 T9SS type A sorting domain-containing protein [Bacteroidota bacterium]